MAKSVAIIGAGVSGLTCGVLFAEGGYRATIFAEETGACTTSAVAAAIWFPYDAEPADKVIAWSLETYENFRELCHDSGSGVSMIELRTFSREAAIEIPAWAHSLGARPLAADLRPTIFASGFTLTVPLIDTTIYLDYLATRFLAAGGEIRGDTHFAKLEDIDARFGTVINCAGIGARTLVPDPGLEPHRGQVVLVSKLNLSHAVVCDDAPLMYAIPRAKDCVFGGTNELSDDRAVNPGITARIVAECARVLNIDPPKVLEAKVGLRPFRKSGIRVARDSMRDGRAVIHNYGHGGAGFTLSWGCAKSVMALADSVA